MSLLWNWVQARWLRSLFHWDIPLFRRKAIVGLDCWSTPHRIIRNSNNAPETADRFLDACFLFPLDSWGPDWPFLPTHPKIGCQAHGSGLVPRFICLPQRRLVIVCRFFNKTVYSPIDTRRLPRLLRLFTAYILADWFCPR